MISKRKGLSDYINSLNYCPFSKCERKEHQIHTVEDAIFLKYLVDDDN